MRDHRRPAPARPDIAPQRRLTRSQALFEKGVTPAVCSSRDGSGVFTDDYRLRGLHVDARFRRSHRCGQLAGDWFEGYPDVLVVGSQ